MKKNHTKKHEINKGESLNSFWWTNPDNGSFSKRHYNNDIALEDDSSTGIPLIRIMAEAYNGSLMQPMELCSNDTIHFKKSQIEWYYDITYRMVRVVMWRNDDVDAPITRCVYLWNQSLLGDILYFNIYNYCCVEYFRYRECFNNCLGVRN